MLMTAIGSIADRPLLALKCEAPPYGVVTLARLVGRFW